jgi:predicted nucleotidyltransferase
MVMPLSIPGFDLPLEEIASICLKHGVEELSVFGSALRPDFAPTSDIDFLVRFQREDAGPWLGKFDDLENDLSRLIGRQVDVVDKSAIEHDLNWVRRKNILSSALKIYVA